MKLFSFIWLLFLVGCAAIPVGQKSSALNNIEIGMSKKEVISTMGQPSRVSANDGVTYLIYLLVDDVNYTQSAITLGLAPPTTAKSDYFIKLKNNKTVSFGKVGDFGTTIESENKPNK